MSNDELKIENLKLLNAKLQHEIDEHKQATQKAENLKLVNDKLTEEIAELRRPEHRKLATWLSVPVILVAVGGFMLQASLHDVALERKTVEADKAEWKASEAEKTVKNSKAAVKKAEEAVASSKKEAELAQTKKKEADDAIEAARKRNDELKASGEELAGKLVAKEAEFKAAEGAVALLKGEIENLTAQKQTIEARMTRENENGVVGRIRDPNAGSIRGASLIATREGHEIAKTTTENDGSFVLKITDPAPFELTISYDLYREEIKSLSGNERHAIFLTLGGIPRLDLGAVRRTLAAYGPEMRLYHKLSPQETATIRTSARIPDEEEIWAALKESGSFSEGIVFTSKGVYFSDRFEGRSYLSYTDFASAQIDYGFITIKINDKKVLGTGYRQLFRHVLDDLQTALRLWRPATGA